MTAVCRLPRELLDLIFLEEQLREEDFRSCTLVCRQWYSAASVQLFRTVTIDMFKPWTITRFRRFLRSGNATRVVRHVKTLRILGGSYDSDNPMYLEMDAYMISSLLARLPSLDALHLDSVWVRKLTSYLVEWQVPRPLKSLSLASCRFDISWYTPSDCYRRFKDRNATNCSLVEVFRMFTCVEQLYLNRIVVCDLRRKFHGIEDEGGKVSNAFKIHKLQLDCEDEDKTMTAVSKLLCHSRALDELQSLQADEGVQRVNEFLEVASPTLRHLDVSLNVKLTGSQQVLMRF